jgi:hypothetical protein
MADLVNRLRHDRQRDAAENFRPGSHSLRHTFFDITRPEIPLPFPW